MKQVILVLAMALALAFPVSADQPGARIGAALLHDIGIVLSPGRGGAPARIVPASCPFLDGHATGAGSLDV